MATVGLIRGSNDMVVELLCSDPHFSFEGYAVEEVTADVISRSTYFHGGGGVIVTSHSSGCGVTMDFGTVVNNAFASGSTLTTVSTLHDPSYFEVAFTVMLSNVAGTNVDGLQISTAVTSTLNYEYVAWSGVACAASLDCSALHLLFLNIVITCRPRLTNPCVFLLSLSCLRACMRLPCAVAAALAWGCTAWCGWGVVAARDVPGTATLPT